MTSGNLEVGIKLTSVAVAPVVKGSWSHNVTIKDVLGSNVLTVVLEQYLSSRDSSTKREMPLIR